MNTRRVKRQWQRQSGWSGEEGVLNTFWQTPRWWRWGRGRDVPAVLIVLHSRSHRYSAVCMWMPVSLDLRKPTVRGEWSLQTALYPYQYGGLSLSLMLDPLILGLSEQQGWIQVNVWLITFSVSNPGMLPSQLERFRLRYKLFKRGLSKQPFLQLCWYINHKISIKVTI